MDRNSSQRPVSWASVALDFFDVLDTPILSGRAFHSGDLQPGARTVIVNQSFAQVVLGGNNPIGRRLRYVTQQNDGKNRGIRSSASCGISASIRKRATRGATRGGPASITWFLAEVIPSAWPSIPRAIPCSSPHACGPSPETSSPRFRSRDRPLRSGRCRGCPSMTLLFWAFLALAVVVVLLSLTGIYSVLSSPPRNGRERWAFASRWAGGRGTWSLRCFAAR